MSSVRGRLYILSIIFLLNTFSRASAVPTSINGFDTDSTCFEKVWADPVPGTNALPDLHEHVLDVGKRECLANGTNFCFDSKVNSCPGCQNCCNDKDRKYCCAGPCCGSGCCSAGQTCSGGKCMFVVEAVTVTSTTFQTSTRIATQRATVVIVQLAISTVVSTVDVTVSSAATQTNVVWETATVTAPPTRRSAVALEHLQPRRQYESFGVSSMKKWLASLVLRNSSSKSAKLPHGLSIAPLDRRQNSSPASTSTITAVITSVIDLVSTTSIIVTITTISSSVTTVYQTKIRVLNAEMTIDVTSTITITNRPPSVRTITTTASLILPAPTTHILTPTSSISTPSTTTSAIPQTNSNTSSGLPTPTIAGIAVGCSALALILAALLIYFARRLHHRSRRPPSFSFDPNSEEYNNNTSTIIHTHQRQPTLPTILPHFRPAAQHHSSFEFQPPSSTSPSQLSHQHQRNGSGFITLVGTPPSFAGAGKPNKDRRSRTSSTVTTPPIFEVTGSDPVGRTIRAEMEGSSPIMTVTPPSERTVTIPTPDTGR